MNRVGYLYLRYERAIAAFELFVSVHPQNANAWDRLGEACAAAGQREDAPLAYEQSLELNPSNGGAAAMLESLRE